MIYDSFEYIMFVRSKESVMRRLLVILGLVASISSAFAQEQEYELPILRGSEEALMPTPPTFTRWRGVYAGGQLGYSAEGANFGNGVNDLAAFTVRNTVLEPVVRNLATLPKANSSGNNYGGFFGYNTHWEGSILGFEINYSRVSVNVGSSADIPPLLISNDTGAPAGHHFVYGLNESGSVTVRITDLATFRARAGWIAGQFLPYAFFGVAVARADVSRSATVTWSRTDSLDPTGLPPALNVPPNAHTQTDVQNGGFYYGYAAGIGMDVFVMPNAFLRGEWEFVQVPNVKGMAVNMNNLRLAVGVKF
jgi:opacity protein-like surface antigen